MSALCTWMLLETCSLAERIWEICLSFIKRAWSRLINLKEALGKELIVEPLSLKANWILDQLPKAIMWVLCNVRNRRVFRGKVKEGHNIKRCMIGATSCVRVEMSKISS